MSDLGAYWDHQLSRSFRPMASLQEFLDAVAVDRPLSEGEMVGLLYEGPNVPKRYRDRERIVRELPLWVSHYLVWTEHSDERIATVARQTLIKGWVYWAGELSLAGGIAGAHEMLLEYLGELQEDLLRPPYPRFVRQYLVRLQAVWDPQNCVSVTPAATAEIQPLTHRLIWASLSWGTAVNLICHESRVADIVPILKEFIGDRRPKSQLLAGNWLALQRGYEDNNPSYETCGHASHIALDTAFSAMLHLEMAARYRD